MKRTDHAAEKMHFELSANTVAETTLYELIEAVNEEVEPEEEQWVPVIVSCILEAGRSDSWLQ